MAREQREEVEVVRGTHFDSKERVIENAPSTRRVLVSRFTKFMWLIAAMIVALLATRFVLVLIAANPATPFVNFIYRLSDVFVVPFNGIVNTPGIDVPAIIAIFVYLFLAWVIITVFHLIFADTNRFRRVERVERQR